MVIQFQNKLYHLINLRVYKKDIKDKPKLY